MSGMWSGRALLVAGLVFAGTGLPAWGQPSASFTGVGVLQGDATSNAYSVSRNGKYVTGESLGSADGQYDHGSAQAFIYETSTRSVLPPIGYPPDWTKSSGQGIDVDSAGHVHVAGKGKNASSNDQAFYYDHNAASFTPIPFLTGGTVSRGQAIVCHGAPLADVVVVGVSSRAAGYDHGFMWKKSTVSLTDLWNTPSSSEPHQSGVDSPCDGASCLAFRGTRMVVRGTGETQYGCGNFSPGAFNYDEDTEYWYNYLLYWAQFDQCPPVTVSTAYGTSQNGDWIVGSSTFDESAPGGQPSCGESGSNRMAYLLYTEEHDDHDTPLELCIDSTHGPYSGRFVSRLLGFLSGHEGFSEAWGVSSTTVTDPITQHAIPKAVVGRACRFYNPNYYPNPNNPSQCDWGEANYVAFIWDPTNGMRNLKDVLVGYGADLNGWELTEARAISDDGAVICGLGLHTVSGNPRWEGWVANLVLPEGACCRSDLTCYDTTQPYCQGTFHGGPTCATYVCCHTPFADKDGDGDVDQMDFAEFQLCYKVAPIPDSCKCFDRGGTSSLVDDSDFTAFSKCWTGPDVPFDPDHPPTGCNP